MSFLLYLFPFSNSILQEECNVSNKFSTAATVSTSSEVAAAEGGHCQRDSSGNVAVIMDGHRRWAKTKRLAFRGRSSQRREENESPRSPLICSKWGIKVLSLFAFLVIQMSGSFGQKLQLHIFYFSISEKNKRLGNGLRQKCKIKLRTIHSFGGALPRILRIATVLLHWAALSLVKDGDIFLLILQPHF